MIELRPLSSRMPGLPLRALIAGATVVTLGSTLALGGPAVATDSTSDVAAKQSLVNEQLVVAQLGTSGLPEGTNLINRIVAQGYDPQNLAVETSTNRLRFLDQTGAPQIEGQDVLYPVGGQPQTTTSTIADFEKPLPIALHAEYATPDGGQRGVNPDDIPGKSGKVDVTYTVTNTTVKRETVTYQAADGTTKSKELPVFAPFVGVLHATLPSSTKIDNPGNAVVGTSSTGETTLTWNLVLYPPIGNYEQRLNFRISGDDLSIPAVTMQAVPISNGQSPSTEFAAKLLGESVKGSQGMIEGLDKVNSGLLELGSGASKLANGSAQLTNGIGTAQSGAAGLTKGANALTAGLDQLTANLNKLAGPQGLSASAEATGEIAKAVKQIATKVGGPWNKPLPEPLPNPLPKDVTLYQILEVLQRGSRVVAQLSASVAATVAQGALDADAISEDAENAKEDADDAANLIDEVINDICTVAGVDPCDKLNDAKTKAQSASSNANAAESGADALDGKLAGAAANAAIVAGATELTYRLMPQVLNQVTALSLALDSRDPNQAGIYQSLMALRGALLRASQAVNAMAKGADSAADGAGKLAGGANQLDNGLGALLGGAESLTDGANALAGGAGQLSSEGTERMMSEIIEASQTSGLAEAYLKAASDRVNEAAPYPTPEGGVSHVAYVYSMAPVANQPNSPIVPITILALLGIGGGILAYRRIRTAPKPNSH
ncbi:MAG: hypothetical protein WAS05_00360 [Candidatus Nanopelagicales bacterium]